MLVAETTKGCMKTSVGLAMNALVANVERPLEAISASLMNT